MNKLFSGIVFCLYALLLTSCNSEKKQSIELNRYISEYTQGFVKSKSSVAIVLEQPVTEFQTGAILSEDVLSCQPNVDGITTLKDERTLVFTPKVAFKNGEKYSFTLHLDKLCKNIAEEFEEFTFKVPVIPLTGHFSDGELNPDTEVYSHKFQATITSTDYVENEDVEKWVNITIDDKAIVPQWKHDGNAHTFYIHNIQRTDHTQMLTLTFIKHMSSQNRFFEIPSKNKFSVLQAACDELEDNCIVVKMSNPIDPKQKPDGLITLSNAKATRYKVENNCIRIYYTSLKKNENLSIHILPELRSAEGLTFNEEASFEVPIKNPLPQVNFIGNGIIMAHEGKTIIPFQAIALEAVDVTVKKVFDQNMVFHLQENSYENTWDFYRTAGTIVHQQKINLKNDALKLNRWNDFTIDLSNITQMEKGVLYNVLISFKRAYTTIYKDEAFIGEEEPRYYSEENWWKKNNDPSSYAYYDDSKFAQRNFIYTSLGVMAKETSTGSYFVAVNDLQSTKAVSDCKIILYNYTNQRIDSAMTDNDGFAVIQHKAKDGFVIKAQKNDDKAWLKLDNHLSLSFFDVSGENTENGLKGYIYGERGVWRPGDDIHLSFIINDEQNSLPQGHPIVATLYNPTGTAIAVRRSAVSTTPIHCFKFTTATDATTGFWKVEVKVGGSVFSKSIRIETVKPNRMSIKMNIPDDKTLGKGAKEDFTVNTRWLSGANAPYRNATTEMVLSTSKTPFPAFSKYCFTDINKYEKNTYVLFKGTTDKQGDFTASLQNVNIENAPGMLSANITTRLDENGGDFSISTDNALYSPFKHYVGIKLPESKDNWTPLQQKITLQGVVLTPDGKKSSGNRNIQVKIYQTQWHWWWDSYNDSYDGSYTYRENSEEVAKYNVTSQNGTFNVPLTINKFGRYIITASDEGGHACSTVAWFGSWSDYKNPDASTVIILECDKEKCNVGDKFKVHFPSEAGGVAIVTLETSNGIIRQQRIETSGNKTEIEITATADMTPNVYVSVSQIQPQSIRANDRPIRLFGVRNVTVDDPSNILHPEIKTAEEIKANSQFNVAVKESNGKPMTYTIAVVDEGLLALTSFKTPSPYNLFYAREALGVKTFDFYNYIFGAYGARLEKAFAVGGDEFLSSPEEQTENRFSSVVLFDGPFTLKAGETATHSFQMPQYIGQVRTMVVAATQDGKYGSAETQTRVTKPLMISLTAPRTFSPGDQFDIPVTLLALNNTLGETTISLSTDEKLEIIGEKQKKVTFQNGNEQFTHFTVRAKKVIGETTFTVKALSANNVTDEKSLTTEIRLPNPPIFNVESRSIKRDESVKIDQTLDGFNAAARLELGSMPPLNLSQRVEELLTYPHGCAEQITSGAFPQLFIGTLTELTPIQREVAESHVKSVIYRLASYQTSDGAMSLWAGGTYPDKWASVYVAHFLTCAQRAGYSVPNEMYQKLIRYIKDEASNYRPSNHEDILQAYRLFTLSMTNENMNSAMNRLQDIIKKNQSEEPSAQYMLAAAYAISGHERYAEKTLEFINDNNARYDYYAYYGSLTRCRAMALMTMVALKRQPEAYQILAKLSEDLCSNQWMSTQSMSFALIAASSYVNEFIGNHTATSKATLNINGKKQEIEMSGAIYQYEIPIQDNAYHVEVTNHDNINLVMQIVTSHTPLKPETKTIADGIKMNVSWQNEKGEAITLGNLTQGSDIYATITVTNSSNFEIRENLALSFIQPSGFEIINERLSGRTDAFREANHVDIRDDRFYVYFNLNESQSKTFRFRMNAAFAGKFTQPAISCNDMYDALIQAVVPGQDVQINANR